MPPLQRERNCTLLGEVRKQVVTIANSRVANHLHTQFNLAHGRKNVGFHGREGSVRFLIALGGVVLILLASLPAAAQHGQGGRGVGRGAPGRPTPPQQVPARDVAGQNANRDARMTPEQRRQLRRDVHDHGRDIYRERTAGQSRP